MAYSITDKCIGCTLCAKNCPVNAISGTLKEKHVVNAEKCISCGLCGKLCAKGAVLKSNKTPAERQTKDKWLRPMIDAQACTGCSICVENCPEYCLELTNPERHGDTHTYSKLADPDKCIGCGICAGGCPVVAIKMVPKEDK